MYAFRNNSTSCIIGSQPSLFSFNGKSKIGIGTSCADDLFLLQYCISILKKKLEKALKSLLEKPISKVYIKLIPAGQFHSI